VGQTKPQGEQVGGKGTHFASFGWCLWHVTKDALIFPAVVRPALATTQLDDTGRFSLLKLMDGMAVEDFEGHTDTRKSCLTVVLPEFL
jgi:hypothetical protein